MNLQTLQQANDWLINSIDVSIGRKQFCMVEDCNQKSFSRFEIKSQYHHINPRFVCSHCASSLTGYHVSTLNETEKYVRCVKPHFKSLKNMGNYTTVSNHNNPNVVGQLKANIGDRRILITKFRDGKYMLLVNGKSYGPGGYNAFLNEKLVIDHAIQVVNNHYTEKNLMDFIYHGTSFVMP